MLWVDIRYFDICLFSKCIFFDNLIFLQILSEKINDLVKLSQKSSLINLDGESYRRFVKNQPRNFSIVVMLTAADPRRGCSTCSIAATEFKIVADSFRYEHKTDSRLFFALADYDAVSQIFTDLNINSAPTFIRFPPSGTPSPNDNLNIQRMGFSAEVIAKWITKQTDVNIRVFRPPNYTGTLLLALFMCLSCSLIYFKRDSLGFLMNRNVWAFISLNVIFYMISGQVWNHIRGPPLINVEQGGRIVFIYPGSDYQFVAETFIVMALYFVISLSFILIYEIKSIADPTKRKTLAIASLLMFTLGLSFLIHVFRRKYQGYPYTFLIR
ncbi:hypothetical protein Ciccas_004421 [Cichlidogyrus casuarinus]|uniref:Magnesium transporter protein 1 n=1 Tax=Cichlidogyrus casuarinus TaxID=1844966 RepID=A0ABD2QF23_9PLAT